MNFIYSSLPPLLLTLLSRSVLAAPYQYDFDQHNFDIHRITQSIPDYTSPPLPEAIDATPYKYRPDTVIDYAREQAKLKLCSTLDDPSICQILFRPKYRGFEPPFPRLGIIFYGGALVDPRSYSPLSRDLSDRYGLAVSIPIFDKDIAFEGCSSDRVELASLAFPSVEKWILVGHSLGGMGVSVEVRNALVNNGGDKIAGLS